mgnify:CR=1 FL=1
MSGNEKNLQELKDELARLKDTLCDIEDVHAFTFVKTSVHIGAEKAQNMQDEYEEECRILNEKISSLERLISEKEGMTGK